MKIKVLMLLLLSNIIYSQISTDAIEVTKPSPSVANLMNFVDIPVNINSGVPNIDVPLIQMPTTNKNINVNIGLSYHPAGITYTNSASDVGVGWNLLGDAVISVTTTGMPDEKLLHFGQVLNWNVNNIIFDDIYSYNFMGYSGKFKLVFDPTNYTFSVQKLDANNSLKIVPEIVSSTHQIDKFIVYDDKGFKYFFDIKDRNTVLLHDPVSQFHFFGSVANGEILPEHYLQDHYNYVSAYHISGIFDNNNTKLINYTYNTHTTPYGGGFITLDKKTNKLNQIEALNNGSIHFDFQYSESLENTLNDPFKLNSITVKNKNNSVVNSFKFYYHFNNVKEDRRFLNRIEKYGINLQNKEEYKFEYNGVSNPSNPHFCPEHFFYGLDKFGYLNNILEILNFVEIGQYNLIEQTSKELCTYGSLKKIFYPTGGRVEFDFESNTFRYNTSILNPNYAFEDEYYEENPDNQIYTTIINADYNTANGNEIPVNITGTAPTKLYFKLSANPYNSDISNDPLYATFKIIGNGINQNLTPNTTTCLGQYIELQPGSYTLKVNSLEYSTGHVLVTKKERTQTLKKWIYGGGLRIKKISHFNSIYGNNAEKVVNYQYNMFDDQNSSSGELFDGYFRTAATNKAISPQVNYRNVKVTTTPNNGYVKYTYEVYSDTQFFQNSVNNYYTHFKNYFGYKDGILKKVEYFNENGKTLKVTQNQYAFEETGSSMYVSSALDYTFGSFYSKPCWTKLISSTNEEHFYPSGSATANVVETNQTYSYNALNKQIAESTATNSNGEVLKTNYYYHTGNSIHSQNRISEIEKVETYRNGQLLSTSKINYANNWGTNVSYLPQTIQSSKGANALETKVKYNKYDAFSNPLEVQQENGTKISYIWGYNNTQPVAKLENIAYDAIPASIITAIKSATDAQNATETSILNALNALRTSTDVNLQKAMITTYTYKPLVGITSVTDPKGDKQTYHYDSFNRLEFVKDKNNNILSENKYHYRTQN